jgi:hypothetical protein
VRDKKRKREGERERMRKRKREREGETFKPVFSCLFGASNKGTE